MSEGEIITKFFGEDVPIPFKVWDALPCQHLHEYNDHKRRWSTCCSKCGLHVTNCLREINIAVLDYQIEKAKNGDKVDTYHILVELKGQVPRIRDLSYTIIDWEASARPISKRSV